MSKNEWKKWLGVVGRMLLAYALIFAQGAWGAQDQATKDKADSLQKAAAQQAGEKQSSAATIAKAQSKQAQGEESESSVAEEKSSGDGKHEGIKVHGHWTIDVRNPDGTLVTHREFENSLEGPQGLVAVLSHTISLGYWVVFLYGQNCAVGLQYCSITENFPGSNSNSGLGFSNNLTLSLTNTPSVSTGGATTLTFNGSVTPYNPTQITRVETAFTTCTPDTSPKGCFALPNGSPSTVGYGLTSANISQSVQSGQMLSVTVVLSFS